MVTRTDVAGPSKSTSEEARKRRALDLARRRASHFATFGESLAPAQRDLEHVEADVMVGGDAARTLGPWNTAYQLADAKDAAKRKREESLLDSRRKAESDATACYACWVPRKDVTRPTAIPSLKSQSRALCSKLIEHVTTLCGVPDDVRADLASEVCGRRQMTEKAFKLFTADTGSSLSIVDCSSIDEEVMRECLAQAVHAGLTELILNMSGRGFTDHIANVLSKEDGVSFAGLQTLVLGGAYRLTDDGVIELLKQSSELRMLGLPLCSRIEGSVVHRLPELTPRLTSLDLSYCGGIPRESLASALAKLDQLDSLTLDGIVDVDDKLLASEEVLMGIKNVGVLSLRNTRLTDVGLRRLASALTNLHSIALDHCTVTTSGVVDMVNACPGLTSVSLKKCTMVDDEAVVHMAKNCELQKLNLNGVGKGVTGASVEALVQARAKSITELDLSWCRHIPERALGYLIELCPRLKVIKLFGCNQVQRSFASAVRNETVAIVGLDDVACDDPLTEMAARGRRIVR